MVCTTIAFICLTFNHCRQNQYKPPNLLIEPVNKDYHRIYGWTLALHCLSAAVELITLVSEIAQAHCHFACHRLQIYYTVKAKNNAFS